MRLSLIVISLFLIMILDRFSTVIQLVFLFVLNTGLIKGITRNTALIYEPFTVDNVLLH